MNAKILIRKAHVVSRHRRGSKKFCQRGSYKDKKNCSFFQLMRRGRLTGCLSYDFASGNEITPCNKHEIDKPLMVQIIREMPLRT